MVKNYEFWFVAGSQDLYGEEVLEIVDSRAREMAEIMSRSLPYPLVYKTTAKSNADIADTIREANYSKECAGVITWCHTFSPSKMWINGLVSLQKPYCHLATQYNREIPNEKIDMDYMNLNQSAHGDREHGFIAARLRMPRKVIAGHWQDAGVIDRLGSWMRVAVGVAFSKDLKVMRFGDNMREVAVTEGDKVETQIKLGWQVNTWAVGDLVKVMNAVTDTEIDELMAEYKSEYEIATESIESIRYQAREEIAMKKMMDREGCKAFANTFQDLYGMEQLPGLASQHLMSKGYGYGGEGDWKVSAMTAVMKAMGKNGNGASAFMEDYMNNRTALITGSYGGLGTCFVNIHASQGGDLILVGRSQEKLDQQAEETKKKYNVDVKTIAVDLSAADAAQKVYDICKENGWKVDYLINNAGFGGHGDFARERTMEQDMSMIAVNIETPTRLCKLFLPDLIERGEGRVLNVSSTAATMPGPLQAVYFASKAYVTSLSNALWRELKGTRVTVTALMPGAMQTGFISRGGLSDTKMFSNAVDPMDVAKKGYDGMVKGELNVIAGLPGWQTPMMALAPMFPKKSMLDFVYNQHGGKK